MTDLPAYPAKLISDSSAGVFDLAPVSLWLEDYSGVKPPSGKNGTYAMPGAVR